MKKFFTKTFFRFFLGFVAILAVSFMLIILASSYKGKEETGASTLTAPRTSA